MYKLIIALALSLVCLSASAADCKKVPYVEGKGLTVNATPNNYTHIILPENVLSNTKPIIGNSDLWSVDHAGPHIYIKPISEHKIGSSTSLSVVGESKVSYDFKVDRHKSQGGCYKLVEGELFGDRERASITHKSRDTSSDLAMLWRQKYDDAKRKSRSEKRTAVLDALRKYRYQIYTRYDWNRKKRVYGKGKRGTKGFIGTDFVSDVYDDGRFTYIRVHQQNKGLMIVEAVLEGRTEIIQAHYDAETKIYTVSGIFPEFVLKYGKSKVKIARADNSTVGEY